MVDLQIVFVKSKRANVDCGLIVEQSNYLWFEYIV